MNRSFASLMHLLRWTCVGLVVLYHVRFLLFAEYAHLAHKGLALRTFYFVTSLGHEAFVVYMLLSGLMLGGLSYDRWTCGPGDPLRDLLRRGAWFYAILIPSLAIGGVLDWIGLAAFARTGTYAYFSQLSVNFGWRAIMGNLLMLQRFVVPGLGSNSMLFLLAYESLALLALATLCRLRRFGGPAAWLGALLVGGIGAWLAPEFLGFWLIWLLGFAVSHLPALPRVHVGRSPGAAAFVLTLAVSRLGGANLSHLPLALVDPARMCLDLVFGAGCALALASLLGKPGKLAGASWPRLLAWRLNRRFPGGCVAILASHFPFMMFAMAAASAYLRVPVAGPSSGAAILVFVAIIAGILAYGFAIARAAFALVRWLRSRPAEARAIIVAPDETQNDHAPQQ